MNDNRQSVAEIVTSCRQSPGNAPTPNVALRASAAAAAVVTRPSSTLTPNDTDNDDISSAAAATATAVAPTANCKRHSGLFAFFKWFRTPSKDASQQQQQQSSNSSSASSVGSLAANGTSAATTSGSTSSLNSTGTAASFSFVAPASYAASGVKCITPGPETDTYRARLKQRDKVRERDKNITLRKKYNLFFGRDTQQKKPKKNKASDGDADDACSSLPLMAKTKMDDNGHRRTNSDSSKSVKAGAYLHVKGKRKAPAPPPAPPKEESSLSLRRKKRVAPQPPPPVPKAMAVNGRGGDIEYADAEVLQNDCLKLDHGVLKQTKELPQMALRTSSVVTVDVPVSPKPWYKRATQASGSKRESRYEPVTPMADNNNYRIANANDKHDKRKSNMLFLTNISELDREAGEIIRNQQQAKNVAPDVDYEMPEFMKPKIDGNPPMAASPKRKSAKDLIAKFNAITNVTKVTVNSALFGGNDKKDYFGPRSAMNGKASSSKVNGHSYTPIALAKCETSACILPVKYKDEPTPAPASASAPVSERKRWPCPKCGIDNDYWRIICQTCSTIKPYFDNFADSPNGSPSQASKTTTEEKPKSKRSNSSAGSSSSSSSSSNDSINDKTKAVETTKSELPALTRSKTQVHLTSNRKQQMQLANGVQQISDEQKREEREKLKKMLIEMKNSLPKRKSALHAQQNRKSTIIEGPESSEGQEVHENNQNQNLYKAKVDPNMNYYKDDKLQTIESKIIQKEKEISNQIEPEPKNPYQLMETQDFENIYRSAGGKHMYANIATSDGHQWPTELNQNLANETAAASTSATDTLEINKLLRRLETAIAKGDMTDAAAYAKELAQLKVNCAVIRQQARSKLPTLQEQQDDRFMVQMYVEDRFSHRGPFPLLVRAVQTVAQLKRQVQNEFKFPAEVQRWILGKELAGREESTLKDYQLVRGSPIFLYLVAPPDDKSKRIVRNVEVKELNIDLKPAVAGIKSQSSIPIPTASNNRSTFLQSEKSAFAAFTPKEVEPKTTPLADTTPPRIVDEHLKVHVMIKPKMAPAPETDIKRTEVVPTATNGCQSIAVKTSVLVLTSPERSKIPPKAIQEDFSEYDRTLKRSASSQTHQTKNIAAPTAHWICHMCTLVNSPTTNICSVCATVRQKVAAVGDDDAKVRANKLHYYELMQLDNSDLVANADAFECLICFARVPAQRGVTLRECLHQFCKECLAHTIEYCEEAEVRCPFRDAQYACESALQGREIKALVTRRVYEQFLAKSVAQAENKMDKSFHCKTADCTGWCVFEDNVNEFKCPICKKTNCLTCQVIHEGINCRQYQERIRCVDSDDAKQTREMLNEMVEKGEALACPVCRVILMKKWGCDWVRCSMCKTEICWVTRGLRWGVGGKGDTSGGCKCGVNGVKCHPKCNYCH